MSPIGMTIVALLALFSPWPILWLIRRDWEEAGIGMLGIWGLGLLVGVVYSICADSYRNSHSDVLAVLRKGEWSCIHTHVEYRPVGKVIMPFDVCDTYQSDNAK